MPISGTLLGSNLKPPYRSTELADVFARRCRAAAIVSDSSLVA
jgi:hypothetical protein